MFVYKVYGVRGTSNIFPSSLPPLFPSSLLSVFTSSVLHHLSLSLSFTPLSRYSMFFPCYTVFPTMLPPLLLLEQHCGVTVSAIHCYYIPHIAFHLSLSLTEPVRYGPLHFKLYFFSPSRTLGGFSESDRQSERERLCQRFAVSTLQKNRSGRERETIHNKLMFLSPTLISKIRRKQMSSRTSNYIESLDRTCHRECVCACKLIPNGLGDGYALAISSTGQLQN